MRRSKRIICLLLCLAVLLAQMPAVFAADVSLRIASAADLLDLAEKVNAGEEGYANASVRITADIDLSVLYEGEDAITTWIPIGTSTNPFTGKVNGGGNTVRGLKIDSANGYQGLFGALGDGADISDLTVDGTVAASGAYVAGVAGYVQGTVTLTGVTNQVKVTNQGVSSMNLYAGGVIAYIASGSTVTLTNCANTGAVSAAAFSGSSYYTYVGGVVGYGISGAVLTGCSNSGAVSGSGYTGCAGGVAGYCPAALTDCVNTGTVAGVGTSMDAGGIAGSASGVLASCSNSGTVSGTSRTGGIVGAFSGSAYSCINIADINATGTVGGVAGQCSGLIRFSSNSGNLTGGSAMGGLTGILSVGGTLRNSASTGNVTAGSITSGYIYTGGLWGSSSTASVIIQDCYSTGKITNENSSLAYAGGLGAYGSKPSITNCFYYSSEAVTCPNAYPIAKSGTLTNVFYRNGDEYTPDVTEDSFAAADGVFSSLKSTKAWKLEEGAAYPTLLSQEEYEALGYEFSMTLYDPDEDSKEMTVSVTKNGQTVALTEGSFADAAAKVGDQYVIAFSGIGENCYLVWDLTSTESTAEKTEVDGVITYTITVGESDTAIRYRCQDGTVSSGAWYNKDTSQSTFTISTAEELLYMAQLFNGEAVDDLGDPLPVPTTRKTYKLGNDIDLSSVCWPAAEADEANGAAAREAQSWPVIGRGADENTVTRTNAIFDGDGHTISNLYIDNHEGKDYVAFFEYCYTIKNVTFDKAIVEGGEAKFVAVADASESTVMDGVAVTNSVITGGSYVGALFGAYKEGVSSSTIYGTISNCHVKNTTVTGTGDYVGGVAGANVQTLYSCQVENSTVTGTGDYVGGVIGFSYTPDSAVNTKYGRKLYQNTVTDTAVAGKNYVGGVSGSASVANQTGGTPGQVSQNTVMGGSVTGASYVGGVFGAVHEYYESANMGSSSTVYGGHLSTATVTASGDHVGGIAGDGAVYYSIYYNEEDGSITAGEDAQYVGEISPDSGNTGSVYLAGSYTDDGGLPESSFTNGEALYLVKNTKVAYKQGKLYPVICDSSEREDLYKVSLKAIQDTEGCSVTMNPAAEDADFAYTLFGQGADAWTYVPTGTAISLTVTAAGTLIPDFYPASAVTVAAEGEGEEAVTTYTLNVNAADLDMSYIFSEAVEADTSWYVTEDEDGNAVTEFTLTDEADLRGFVQLVNGGNKFTGMTVKLADDIVLAGGGWTPVGASSTDNFAGTFDGGNHKISGLFLNQVSGSGTSTYAGLFGYLASGAAVRNLTVSGLVNSISLYTGGVVGFNDGGSLTGITSDVDVTVNYANSGSSTASVYTGGIVGYDKSSGMTDVTNLGDVTADMGYAGGIAGYTKGDCKNAVNTGNISLFGGAYIGGIVGNSGGSITGAVNSGSITAAFSAEGSSSGFANVAGGIAGLSSGSLTDVENTGDINVSGAQYVGGILGGSTSDTISGAVNRGAVNVSGVANASTGSARFFYGGGILGYASSSMTLTDCLNYGEGSYTVNGTNGYIGGVLGYASSAADMFRCGNGGTIASNKGAVGGVLGYAKGVTEIYLSYNTGGISMSDASAGSLIGGILANPVSNVSVIIGNSYNTGDVILEGVNTEYNIFLSGIVGSDAAATTIFNTYTSGAIKLPEETYSNVCTGNIQALSGSADAASCTNVYYLNDNSVGGTEPSGVIGTNVIKAADLSVAFTDYAESTPVLHWQVDDPSAGVIVNYNDSYFYAVSQASGVNLCPGSLPDIIVVYSLEKAGEILSKEAVSDYETFTFGGWYTTVDGESVKYDPETTILSDGDMYTAQWLTDSKTITFRYNWPAAAEEQPAEYTASVVTNAKASTAAFPEDPVLEGYEFLGWYVTTTDEEGNLVFPAGTFDTAAIVDRDIVLDARWQAKDTSWYNEEETSFTITTAEQLLGLASLVNGGNSFTGKTVTLGNDIEMEDYAFIAIGTAATPFSGTFDGNGKRIDGVKLYQPDLDRQGLFGYASGAVIQNLTAVGASVTGADYTGGIVGYAVNSTLSNVSFSGSVAGDKYVGGIIGYDTGTSLNNVTFGVTGDGSTVTAAGNYSAGLVAFAGYVNEYQTMTECVNNGDIQGTMYVGGLIGDNRNVLTLTGCANNGSVTAASNYAGGLIGDHFITKQKLTMTNCCNTGTVSGNMYTGGLFGYLNYGYGDFNASYNTGAVSGSMYIGGLAGQISVRVSQGNVNFTDCYNIGDVSAAGNYAGGLAGYFSGYNTSLMVNFINCYVGGTVTGGSNNSAIGHAYNTYWTAENCYCLASANSAVYSGKATTANINVTTVNSYEGLAEKLGDNYQDGKPVNVLFTTTNASVTVDGETVTSASAFTAPALIWQGESAANAAVLTFRVVTDAGCRLDQVTLGGTVLTSNSDGSYTATLTEEGTITVSAFDRATSASKNIEQIIASVTNGTTDEEVDVNQDSKSDLLDILEILYQQQARREAEEAADDSVSAVTDDGADENAAGSLSEEAVSENGESSVSSDGEASSSSADSQD